MSQPVSSAFSNAMQEYIVFFRRLAEEEIPVTINVIITADVTDEHRIFNEHCMTVMKPVRNAIRGK